MRREVAILSLVLVFGGAFGCFSRTPPPEFFTLRPAATAPLGAPHPGLALAVGPIDFPRYLDRSEIVRRDSANRLVLSGAHRWGGSLKNDMLRVVADDLGTLLGTSEVAIYPTEPRSGVDYRVRLDLREFEPALGGPVVLRLHWAILAGAAQQTAAVRASRVEQPLASSSWADQVAAQSAALGAVSREIAEQLAALHAAAP
jgi:uncharacterized lipoprotein YmbA